jgi:pimeloyl-ACP methyl ester carboxylesterase
MADWDMNKYVHDTRTGMAVARIVRLFTGNGFRKMNLLGYSGGATLALAVATKETTLPRGWRHAEGLIPVDQGFFSEAEWAASDCAGSQYYADLIDSGQFVEENPFPLFGEPAQLDPDGDSELIPGFTNLQAALAVAVYPYTEGFPYHFLAGAFDEDAIPTGLQYTNVDLWIDFLIQAPPFFANAFSRDELISACGAEYAPWTHQLGDIELPVLFVSAAGGFGLLYGPTLDAMVSADVTMLTVELHPAEEVELDFAHIDLFTADNAPQLVWQPIKQWVVSRNAFAIEAYPQAPENRD